MTKILVMEEIPSTQNWRLKYLMQWALLAGQNYLAQSRHNSHLDARILAPYK